MSTPDVVSKGPGRKAGASGSESTGVSTWLEHPGSRAPSAEHYQMDGQVLSVRGTQTALHLVWTNPNFFFSFSSGDST